MRVPSFAIRGLGLLSAAETIFQMEEAEDSAQADQFNAEYAGDQAAALAANQQAQEIAQQQAAVYAATPPTSQAQQQQVASVLQQTAPVPVVMNPNPTVSAPQAANLVPNLVTPIAVQAAPSSPAPPPPTIVATTSAAAAVACAAGYTVDASGICALYTDSELLAGLNSIQWTGTGDIPSEQINRIDSQILAQYGAQPNNVTPGSVLAYILGLGGSAASGATVQGDNGTGYTMQGGDWVLTSSIPPPATPAASTVTAGSTATSSYTPSSDDLDIYAAIGVIAPYTQAEITFAQAVESLGSPVSSIFSAAQIAAAYAAYNNNGGSVVSAIQSLTSALTGATAASQSAAGSSVYPAGSFSTSYAGALTVSGSGYAVVQINSDGSGTVLGIVTAAQLQSVTLTAPVQFANGVYLNATDLATVESAAGLSSGLSSTTLLLIAAGVAAFFLIKK